jgi:hypothetical protein
MDRAYWASPPIVQETAYVSGADSKVFTPTWPLSQGDQREPGDLRLAACGGNIEGAGRKKTVRFVMPNAQASGLFLGFPSANVENRCEADSAQIAAGVADHGDAPTSGANRKLTHGPHPRRTGANMTNDSGTDSTPFIDRRNPDQQRKAPGMERRQFSNSHRDLSPEAAELGRAIDQYKLVNRRRFITYEEMLNVIKQLGYSKQ